MNIIQLIIRGVPNSDFCRIRIFCRIHFAESEYSAEYSALPNNEKNMFKSKKRKQKITNYDYRRVIKQFCTSKVLASIILLYIYFIQISFIK